MVVLKFEDVERRVYELLRERKFLERGYLDALEVLSGYEEKAVEGEVLGSLPYRPSVDIALRIHELRCGLKEEYERLAKLHANSGKCVEPVEQEAQV